MKYFLWALGDPESPAWVSFLLALVWTIPTFLNYQKSQWSFATLFCLINFGIRLGMSVGHKAR